MRAAAGPAARARTVIRGPRGARGARAAAGAGAAAAAALLAGCTQPAVAATPMQIGPAYVTQPGQAKSTSAYMTIQNNTSRPDRLVSASTSAGGQVRFYGPGARGAVTAVSAIPIPADRTVRLRPNSYHLTIIDPGHMTSGHQITLKLVFARTGTIRIAASVTNPQSGGSSYFLN